MATLNHSIDNVEAFLFTGGIANSRKTDFHFEYKGTDGNYHQYFPDFVIVKKNGEFYIVEIKEESRKNDPNVEAKKKAVMQLVNLQSDKHFDYKVTYTEDALFTDNSDDLRTIQEWIYGSETSQNNSDANILQEKHNE